MRNSTIKNDFFHPLKSPDIDRSKSKPLIKTIAPIAQILKQTSPLPLTRPHSATIKSLSDRNNTSYEHGSIELWISKYEYVKRDNELLQSQIAYLNDHINQLNAAKKKEEAEFMRKLGEVSKVFMQQLVNCQQNISNALEEMDKRQHNLSVAVGNMREKIKNNQASSPRKIKLMEVSYNCQFEELFQVKIQNTKLLTRVRVLEDEIKELGNKYVSNCEWKTYSLNIFSQLQKKMVDRVFTPMRRSDIMGTGSNISHTIQREGQRCGFAL